MLKMRLARQGRKKRPYYRVVVAESSKPRDGRFHEILGHYDPLAAETHLTVKEERVAYWLSQGAQPSLTVHRLLHKQGLMDEYKPKPRSKKADAKRDAAAAAE
jgi:small subunit ribosomal protein S16